MNATFVLFLTFIALPAQHDDTKEELWSEYRSAMIREDHRSAERVLTRIIETDEKNSTAYYLRGRLRFQLAKPNESVSDFDQHVKLSPKLEARQWERGISMYYAGKFKEGAAQFKLYQTYHDNDVENSAWRFLCVAKSKSIAEAQKNLLPIKNDTRVPMMEIYKMLKGELSSEEVLAAAKSKASSEFEKNAALFYANLYIGLMKEVEGKTDESLKFILEAKKHKISHYMWDVANVHAALRGDTRKEK